MVDLRQKPQRPPQEEAKEEETLQETTLSTEHRTAPQKDREKRKGEEDEEEEGDANAASGCLGNTSRGSQVVAPDVGCAGWGTSALEKVSGGRGRGRGMVMVEGSGWRGGIVDALPDVRCHPSSCGTLRIIRFVRQSRVFRS